MPKAKKMGRPKLPKGHAKGVIVPVRVNPDDRKLFEKAAKESEHKTLSGWIRHTLKRGRREMKKTLATIGFFLFPFLIVFCLIAFVMLGLSSHNPNFTPDRAMRTAAIYRAILLISVVGYAGSIVVLIRSRKSRRPKDVP